MPHTNNCKRMQVWTRADDGRNERILNNFATRLGLLPSPKNPNVPSKPVIEVPLRHSMPSPGCTGTGVSDFTGGCASLNSMGFLSFLQVLKSGMGSCSAFFAAEPADGVPGCRTLALIEGAGASLPFLLRGACRRSPDTLPVKAGARGML